jgi:multimeric flavodoxin WrbA
MKRCAINGSPRGKSSNSRIILSWILDGVAESSGMVESSVPQIIDLAASPDASLRAALEADEIILAFPLYTDFVPGIVKEFFDGLAAFAETSEGPPALKGKRAAFAVHSGFPEPAQSEHAAAWLHRACGRLGMDCAGVLIKGGSEGLRMMSPGMTKKPRLLFMRAGASLARDGRFDPRTAKEIAGRRSLSLPARIAIRLLKPTGLFDIYWITRLKKYGGWARRFDRPYQPKGV